MEWFDSSVVINGSPKIFFLDSEEADTLEELKTKTAAEQAKGNRRRKFQAQDSVLVEALGKSVDE